MAEKIEDVIEKFIAGKEVNLDSIIKFLLIKEYKEGKIPAKEMLTYLMMLRALKG